MDGLEMFLLFAGGIVIGLCIPFLVKSINSQLFRNLIDGWKVFLRKKKRPKRQELSLPQVDPREQQLSDSAQEIRAILLSLAALFRRTGEEASLSSTTLGDVRSHIDALHLPSDLSEVHHLLIVEIDRMIQTNNHLKEELANAQQSLEVQRRQIESLKTAVRIDGLTQMANRTYFDEKLAEMIRYQKRYREPFSLLMVDVDDFKTVNDAYGHLAGDRILKGIAVKLKASVRESDFIARYGGDEFALILSRAGLTEAEDVAEKICRFLRESRFFLDGKEIQITLSIGATVSAGDTLETLIDRADQALYLAKERGKSQVMVLPPPLTKSDPVLPRDTTGSKTAKKEEGPTDPGRSI